VGFILALLRGLRHCTSKRHILQPIADRVLRKILERSRTARMSSNIWRPAPKCRDVMRARNGTPETEPPGSQCGESSWLTWPVLRWGALGGCVL